jgi:hypothetical protein
VGAMRKKKTVFFEFRIVLSGGGCYEYNTEP